MSTTTTTRKSASKEAFVKVTADEVQSDFVSNVQTAIESDAKSNEFARKAAKILVQLRESNEYKGRAATAKNPAIPEGVDWNGLGDGYRAAKKQLMDAALPQNVTDNWSLRTGKPASAMPIIKLLDYYVEVEMQARFKELFGSKARSAYEGRGLKWGTRYERAKAAADERARKREAAKEAEENGEEPESSTPSSVRPAIQVLTEVNALLRQVVFSTMSFDDGINVNNLLREASLRVTTLQGEFTAAMSAKPAAPAEQVAA